MQKQVEIYGVKPMPIVAETPVIANALDEDGAIYKDIDCIAPNFEKPLDRVYTSNLKIEASVSDGGTLSYIWDLERYYAYTEGGGDSLGKIEVGNVPTLDEALFKSINFGESESLIGTVTVVNTKDGATAQVTVPIKVFCVWY